jgi:predicted subunit of tRNA(5-methylaminomethyl-2-thiouridylate) methyltransferase
VPKADYEDELRTLIAEEHGEGTVDEVFPAHDQTYVHGRND